MIIREKEFLQLYTLTVTIATIVDNSVGAQFDVKGVFGRRVITQWDNAWQEDGVGVWWCEGVGM